MFALLLTLSIMGCANNSKTASSEKGQIDPSGPLVVNCTVMSRDFSELNDTLFSKEAVLSKMKHQPGGAVNITNIGPYEFWVMVHGMVLGGQSQITNYQVAIKDKRTNQFMHALSDTSLNSNNPPKAARISLVEYYPESLLEKGELLFECK